MHFHKKLFGLNWKDFEFEAEYRPVLLVEKGHVHRAKLSCNVLACAQISIGDLNKKIIILMNFTASPKHETTLLNHC